MGGIDENTKLLIRPVHEDGNWVAKDVSGNNHSVSNVGGVLIEAGGPLGTQVMRFHTGKYLSSPNSPDFNFGTQDFTIDFWFRLDGWLTGYHYTEPLVCFRASTIMGWNVMVSRYTAPPTMRCGNVGTIYNAPDFDSLGQYFHLCWQRNGTTLSVFLDGVPQEDLTVAESDAVGAYSGELYIGRFVPETETYINGTMTEIRISSEARTKNPADPLYIPDGETTFTPPIAPYSVFSGGFPLIDGFGRGLIQ